jgi:hypothetical protein
MCSILLAVPEATSAKGKKRGGRQPAAKKTTRTKKSKVSKEEEKAIEEGKRVMWKDEWIVQLIAARIRRDAEFNQPKNVARCRSVGLDSNRYCYGLPRF